MVRTNRHSRVTSDDGACTETRGTDAQKKTRRATERERADIVERREAFRKRLETAVFEKIVYIDEFGVNLAMAPRYAWSPKGERAIGYAPGSRGTNISVVAAVRADGVLAWRAWDGSIDGDRFLEFMGDNVVAKIRPGDLVILDNASIHGTDAVRAAVEKAGGCLVFIPPYHPEFNAAEEVFSFIKHHFRRAKPRCIVDLVRALQRIFSDLGLQRIWAFMRHALALTAQSK